jgi:hypothetical protein
MVSLLHNTELVDDRSEKWYGIGHGDEPMLYEQTAVSNIAAEIREAIDAEREECAKIADEYEPKNADENHLVMQPDEIAKLIRARGNLTPTDDGYHHKKGDIIKCPNNHEIADLLDDIASDEKNLLDLQEKWRNHCWTDQAYHEVLRKRYGQAEHQEILHEVRAIADSFRKKWAAEHPLLDPAQHS